MSHHAGRALTLSILAAAVLAACGGGDSGDKKTATQVAAKVNGGEVSVHQINQVMQRTNVTSPEQAKTASRQVLERLIDQELLVQQALDKKLDRDPRTLQAIEAARREVLSRAYLEQVSAAASKPTESEIKAYYEAHPELFSERRIFNLRELSIQAGPEFAPKLQAYMAEPRNLQQLAEWLRSENVRFSANAVTKPAEQLPLEMVKNIHQLKDGQMGMVRSGNAILVLEVAASRSAPVDEKAAQPIIEQFLLNQRKTELAKAEVKNLREKGKIEYMGEFSAPEPAAAEPAAPASATEPAVAAPTEAPANDNAIDKGLSGLK
ncbi:MAG: EpsD family peptidyl-prolyl cis-trans isomerase [Gammaproteobacteria bacterium]|jgi:EpsD family peptidyl-prolyl cis-trans isomerase|nr:EpsD family peptidyl-prolyl cis-trans isomerase [Gammaproteobacteria bacterium]MBU0771533.1 EpsD family peptidyl-prolyl cis-trans isomerase [Gammaproteobacteria bacterium]MBU0856038.1 EpsD family peptidyl-prolyl cis-trans isomerase [Gammaproteobacteria bacterium]MBU1846627.1 EpsD family peptidyl-prolyl cis-trans isomerase [Gammaproteobacteria bacterium]